MLQGERTLWAASTGARWAVRIRVLERVGKVSYSRSTTVAQKQHLETDMSPDVGRNVAAVLISQVLAPRCGWISNWVPEARGRYRNTAEVRPGRSYRF
jgi:hypothetical protein